MSEESAEGAEAAEVAEGTKNGEEPSMEDILASIRRIVSEEEEEAQAEEEMAATVAAEPEPAPEPSPPPMEDVLQLKPDMVAPEIMSAQTAQASTDVLAELARVILDRRDLAISSDRDLTIEGMVREMLKPILREWLDRNLPYIIERLVKKEIDVMINRAERL